MDYLQLIFALLQLILTNVSGLSSGNICSITRGSCTVTSQLLEGNRTMYELYCNCGIESMREISPYLDMLKTAKCRYIPDTPTKPRVHKAIVNITDCQITEEEFPEELLAILRRTEVLHLIFHGSSARLHSVASSKNVDFVSTITAHIENSRFSGLGRGWLSHTENLSAFVTGGEINILESLAFSGFPDNASVHINITGTKLTTIKMFSMQLPANGYLYFDKCRVSAWESDGLSGGRNVELNDLTIGRFDTRAINIYHLDNLRMRNNTLASVMENCLDDNAPQSWRKSEGVGIPENPEEARPLEISLIGNWVTKAFGTSFTGLCIALRVFWKDNVFLDIVNPPLRLQNRNCIYSRNWDMSVFNTHIDCSCDNFEELDEQVCTLYRSAYCIERTDGNNVTSSYPTPLLHRVPELCGNSHARLAERLKNVCGEPREESGNHGRRLISSDVSPVLSNVLYTVFGLLYVLFL